MLRQGHHVHVAFHHQHPARLANRLARLVQAIQLLTFFEQGSFRRIEVFGLALPQHAAAETDHRAALVEDGKHDAVAEAVVALAAFALDHQPRLHQGFRGVIVKNLGQILPCRRRIADAEARRDFAGKAALLEVLDRLGRTLELIAVIARGLQHELRPTRCFATDAAFLR